ncbi:hypothetical protein C7B77_08275 [Chamaesiphon polymorphus CCALA 037]|uniref:Uncharacterized protein n=1 Tax=Chamaesiphon polymorphus CCALA 037 TaxID=2107692 RepID=A0A2T1GIB6_9CYAN|nr:hypothetical protein C7B77_08275 [Chamaesiphon polymorphus CCALA 037]
MLTPNRFKSMSIMMIFQTFEGSSQQNYSTCRSSLWIDLLGTVRGCVSVCLRISGEFCSSPLDRFKTHPLLLQCLSYRYCLANNNRRRPAVKNRSI